MSQKEGESEWYLFSSNIVVIMPSQTTLSACHRERNHFFTYSMLRLYSDGTVIHVSGHHYVQRPSNQNLDLSAGRNAEHGEPMIEPSFDKING